MGAWGEKAFENDAAADWLAELAGGGVAAVRGALSRVADDAAEEDVDVDDGSAAIAAAEIVAAALGCGEDRVPQEAVAWLAAHRATVTAADGGLARRAVERVVGEDSELRSLWDENGTDSPWHAEVAVLVARLAGATGSPPAGGTAKGRAGRARKPRAASLREKQAILTMFLARGLVATDEQVARIEACTDAGELRLWLSRVLTAPTVEAVLAPAE